MREEPLTEWNCSFFEDLFYAWAGFAVAEIIFLLNEKHGLNMSVGDVARRKEELYLEALANLRAVPEVLEHVEGTQKLFWSPLPAQMSNLSRL